jgi:hypothetical protein
LGCRLGSRQSLGCGQRVFHSCYKCSIEFALDENLREMAVKICEKRTKGLADDCFDKNKLETGRYMHTWKLEVDIGVFIDCVDAEDDDADDWL